MPEVNGSEAAAYSDTSKHYVTLVFTDGDNCQWIQNGYSEYHEMMEKYPSKKITWTYSPLLQELNPLANKRTYLKTNENQYFIAGPSGIGYCNPSDFDGDSLDLMSKRTASAMLKSNPLGSNSEGG